MGISKANQQTAKAKDELRQSADSSLRAVSPIAAKQESPGLPQGFLYSSCYQLG